MPKAKPKPPTKPPTPWQKKPTSFRLTDEALATIRAVREGLGLKSDQAALNVVFKQLDRELKLAAKSPPLPPAVLRVLASAVRVTNSDPATLGIAVSLSNTIALLVGDNADAVAADIGVTAAAVAEAAARLSALRPVDALWAVGVALAADEE